MPVDGLATKGPGHMQARYWQGIDKAWWRHDVNTLSALLAYYVGYPSKTGAMWHSSNPKDQQCSSFMGLLLFARLAKENSRVAGEMRRLKTQVTSP